MVSVKMRAACALGLLAAFPAVAQTNPSGQTLCVDWWPGIAHSIEASQGTPTSTTVAPGTVLTVYQSTYPHFPTAPMPFFATLRDEAGIISPRPDGSHIQAFCLATTCGNFLNGQTPVATEEIILRISPNQSNEVFTWRAPSTGDTTCTIRGIARSNSVEWTVNVAEPPPPPDPPPPPPDPPAPPPTTTMSGRSPSGAEVKLWLGSVATSTCTLASADFIDPAPRSAGSAPPAATTQPYGAIDFRVDNCGFGQSVTFVVELPEPLPPTAQWWKYGPTPDNRTPHWYPIAAVVDGNRITFSITDGGLGDDDLMINGSIRDLGMVAIPGGGFQDLWWSGLAENGWGMSIIQHRDVLFANIFVYDAQGNPVWYVMPSGTWNAAHTAYTGKLYLPKGSPFYAYDASQFDIGASVGSATLTFANPAEANFAYTINGVSAQKNLSRLSFGPQDGPLDHSYADLWWAGSAQNGWGLALLQQHSSLFGLWFTYDASGKATWFVMPAGNWTLRGQYDGKVFRAQGPAWLGVPYDASRHRTLEAGTFRLRVTPDAATFDYSVDGRSASVALSRIPF